MKKTILTMISLAVIIVAGQIRVSAQNAYTDYGSLVKKIKDYQSRYPDLCTARPLVTTAGGREIWVVSIGSGSRDNKPGIAIFGGVEGNHILGREIALGFISSLLDEAGTGNNPGLLYDITFYVFPDVSPDASEQFFSGFKYERNINAASTDDDHDFVIDEDGYEDLNKDGLITMMRVEDPSGRYTMSKEDDRVMVEADISKGEEGRYLLYTEGIDNDKDNRFNEDGPGGVNFNRNFTFNYEFFGQAAGMYPVSEPESKAVADFLFDHFNIYTVISFGPQDNLGQPMKHEETKGDNRIIASITKEDEAINKLVSDKYHEITGVSGAPVSDMAHGNFMEWAYFHYGRYSFGTPAWWFNAEKGKNRETEFLRYAGNAGMKDVFVPWSAVVHPDFPGKKTEVGGILPFIMNNPPADSLEKLISVNYRFIKTVAMMHPRLEFTDLKAENAGEGIFRISVKLHNAGIFATAAKIGENNIWTRIMRINLETSKGQSIISGQKTMKAERLDGGQSEDFSWLVSGSGKIRINAGALNTGSASAEIELR